MEGFVSDWKVYGLIEPKILQCSINYTCKILGIVSLLGFLNTKCL